MNSPHTSTAYRPAWVRPWTVSRSWWLHPTFAVLLLVTPIYLSFLGYDFSQVNVPSFIPSGNYWWGLLLLVMLGVGGMVGASMRLREEPPLGAIPVIIPNWVMASLLFMTLLAYALWFYPVALDPSLLAMIFGGERGNLRGLISTKPGITTFTQCGVAYVIACAIKPHLSGTKLARWERIGLYAVFALTAFRMIAWAERLAVMEILIAYLIPAWAFKPVFNFNKRRLIALIPLVAPAAVYLMFAGTEYFRSWEFYRTQYSSIWSFALDRLLTYYATASNNGIGLLQQTTGWPEYTGRFVFEWAYVLPGAGKVLTNVFGDSRIAYQDFLEGFAREEFNNPSGLFPIVYDVGYFGSAMYFLLVGIIVGMVYKRYAAGRMAGLLGYSSCFLFMIELLRFNYFSASRFVPIVASLVFIAMTARKAHSSHAAWRAAPVAS